MPKKSKPTPTGEPKLTVKQKRFCEEYVLNRGNATEAARKAGYAERHNNSLRSVASQNLTKVDVIAHIAQLRSKIEKEFAVTAEEVIGSLRKARDRAFADVAVLDREGEPTGEYRNDLRSAISATELLGRTIGLFIDRKELSGNNGEPLQVVIELPSNGR